VGVFDIGITSRHPKCLPVIRFTPFRLLWSAVAVALGTVSCSSGQACTTDLRPAVAVTVVDAAGQRVCDAQVVASDHGFSQNLTEPGQNVPSSCGYFGASERPGVYEITVTKGRKTGLVHNVKVTKNACHVNTQLLTITIR